MTTPLIRIVSLACLALLAVIAFVTIRTWTNPPIARSSLERIVEIRQDTTRHYIDEAGRTHGETRVATADAATLQAVYPFMDSVLRSMDVTRRQVDALVAMSTATAGTIRPKVEPVQKGDKTFQRITYKDKWLDLDGIISDSPSIKYSVYDSFLITTYWKKRWWLGKKETFLDAYSLNPASKVNNLTGLKVSTERPRRFGIGPYIGYGWNGNQWSPSVGLSLQYSVIKF